MSFRGTQHFRMNPRALMVKGGAVDGLADLAKAFIEAPIMRRKIELANKRLAQQAADADEARKFRHEEHAAAMEIANRKLDGAGSTALKPTQINGIAQGIMAHARQAATTDDVFKGKIVDEAKARKEYEHLRRLVPESIRSQIPDYDGGMGGEAAAPSAQHAALDDATGPDAEGTGEAKADPGEGIAPDEAPVDRSYNDRAANADSYQPVAMDEVGGMGGDDPGADLAPPAAAPVATRPAAQARKGMGVMRSAWAGKPKGGGPPAAAQEADPVQALLSNLHPNDQAAYQRILATGEPDRIAAARQRLLESAQGPSAALDEVP